jgi:hypothetical protein
MVIRINFIQVNGIKQTWYFKLPGYKATADILRKIESYFNKASLVVKQKLIGLIFSGKLVFQNNSYQTTPYHLVIQRICSMGKDFGRQKKSWPAILQASLIG